MLNNFCLHVYVQKSVFIGENANAFFDTLIITLSCEFRCHRASREDFFRAKLCVREIIRGHALLILVQNKMTLFSPSKRSQTKTDRRVGVDLETRRAYQAGCDHLQRDR